MGRRRKLTRKVIQRLRKEIARGLPYDTAARLAGIHPATFYRWKRDAEEARAAGVRRGILVDFLRAVEEADAEAERALLERVVVQGGAKGAMWVLERRWPEKWGQRVDVKLEGVVFALDWGVEADEDDAGDSAAGGAGEDAADAPAAT